MPKHHKGFFAAAYMLFHRHVDEVTWKAHSQVAVTRTMEHRRQSNKKGSPTFLQLHVSERREPRVSQLNGDHATESGLTTQVPLLKSLESNGDRRNYLSSWEENVERRLAVVSEGPARAETRRSRILDIQAICLCIGPLRWAYLASSSASVRASLSSHRPGSGCQPRLDSLHARLPSISECSAANTADKVRTNDTHYCFIDID